MKGLFGVVSLLVVLVVIGLVAVKQLRAVGHVSVEPTGAVNAAAPAGTTVPEQSLRLQDKVRGDVVKALEQGAARTDDSQK
jgi:sorbitol-specific phosphotransferase system component IIA